MTRERAVPFRDLRQPLQLRVGPTRRPERSPEILAALRFGREVRIAQTLIGLLELDYLGAVGRVAWGELI